jgi:hypothetical protein
MWHLAVAAIEVMTNAKALYYLFIRAAQSQDVAILTFMPSPAPEPSLVSHQPDAFMAGMHHSIEVPWLFPAAAIVVSLALEGLGILLATIIETRQRRIFMRQSNKIKKR